MGEHPDDRGAPGGPIAWRFAALGGLTAGLAASPWLAAPIGLRALAVVGLALALLAVVRPGPGSRARALAWLALLAALAATLGAGIGTARLAAIDAGALRLAEGERVLARGHLTAVPDRYDGLVALRLQTPQGRLLVEAREPVPPLAVGGLVAARGTVRAAREWEAARLRRLGVATVLAARTVRPLGARRGGLAGTLDGIRGRAEDALGRGTAEQAASLLRGFVLGQDDLIEPATVAEFKRAGLSHLLRVYSWAITTSTDSPPLRLDAYLRVSRTNGRSGDSFISPDQQRDKIKAWAKLRGVRIAKWHEPDLDQSGGKLTRPNFDRALARVEVGKTGGIVVAKLDRFSRAGVADALQLIESIHEARGVVASVEENIDPTTPTGEFTMTLFLALARMQRQQTGENWNDARRRAVEDRGVHIASKIPTGYVKGEDGRLEPHPDFAEHIAEVFRLRAEGGSWRDLGLYLRKYQVESPYGTTDWQPRALSHLISNRVYLGEARSGEFVNVDAHPAIVDEATWEAAQRAKGERPVNSMGGALLAGLLRCEGCGYVLKPDTMRDRDGSKLRLYRCRTERSSGRCPSPASVLGRVVEPWIVDLAFQWIGGVRAEGTALTADLSEAEAAVVSAEAELAAYLGAISVDDVGADAFRAGAQQRRDAARAAQARLEHLRDQAGLADLPLEADLRQSWPNLTVHEQREVLAGAIDGVILGRGRRSIDKRARIVWKGGGDA